MKNRLLQKLFVGSILIFSVAAFSGCSLIQIAPFQFTEASSPDTKELVSYEESLNRLPGIPHPVAVEEPKQPDKTLYNALSLASTSGLKPLNVLIGNSYFTYDSLEKNNLKAIDALTEATNVNMVFYSSEARTDWKMRCSGFVYRIDDDYIYIGTAGHCIAKKAYLKYATIMFADRVIYKVDLSDYKRIASFRSAKGDIAMYRIPVSAIPKDELLKLREVCWDKEMISAVKEGDVLYTGNIYAKNIRKDYDKNIPVVSTDNKWASTYINKYDYDWMANSNYILSTADTTSGQSGSAIFNQKGYAVALVSGYVKMRGDSSSVIGIYTTTAKLQELYDQFQK